MTDHSQAMTAKYRQDYQAPLYWIDTIDLDFQLQEPLTQVMLPSSSTNERFVFRLYMFLDQFSIVE